MLLLVAMTVSPPRRVGSEAMAGAPSRRRKARRGISIVATIMALFVVVAVAASLTTFFVVDRIANAAAREFGREKGELVSRAINQRIAAQLEPAEAQAAFLSRLFSRIDVAAASVAQTSRLLYASLASAAQVSSVALVGEDLSLIRAFRNRPNEPSRVSDWSDDVRFASVARKAWAGGVAAWGPPFYAETSGETLISHMAPFTDAAGARYLIISSVSLFDLSAYLRGLESEFGGTPFILYGRDAVLAHPAIVTGAFRLSDASPTPSLRGFPDWRLDALRPEVLQASSSSGGVVAFGDVSAYYLLEPVVGFGPEPWIVGSVFELRTFSPINEQAQSLLIAGLAIALGVALVALVIGRAISWPLRTLSDAARQIRRWDVEHPPALRRSVFHEINQANEAFAAAFKALRSLWLYLPRSLPPMLLESEDPRELESKARMVSVMFTDIAGFTAMSEDMPPAEVAALLNEHFAIVSSCIQNEQGVVDKFIGDAVMAFWGGLAEDSEHAARACRAALAIKSRITADNERRAGRGAAPVRVRVGVHSGEAIVGNIGSPGRANFTIIGDTVNVAERLEAMARKACGADEDVAVLVSAETARLAGDGFRMRPIGVQPVAGRRRAEDVLELVATSSERPGDQSCLPS